jgi:hypothetical protein
VEAAAEATVDAAASAELRCGELAAQAQAARAAAAEAQGATARAEARCGRLEAELAHHVATVEWVQDAAAADCARAESDAATATQRARTAEAALRGKATRQVGGLLARTFLRLFL